MSTLVLSAIEDLASGDSMTAKGLTSGWEFVASVDCASDSQFLFYHDGIDSGSDFVEGYDYLISYGSVALSADTGQLFLWNSYEADAYVTSASAYVDVGYQIEQNYVATTAPQRIVFSAGSPSYGYASWRGGNTTARGLDGYILITNAADTARKTTIDWKSQGEATTYNHSLGSAMSKRNAAAACQHIKIYPSGSLNMATGRIDLLRRKAA